MLNTRARVLLAAAALLCVAPAPAALAQTTDSAPITVTGRTPEQVSSFVRTIATAPGTSEQLGRWDRTICTSIAGLPARQGQFVADRIAQRAHAVGLEPGESGCNANVSVIVTNDAKAAVRRMFERDPQIFAYRQESNVNTLGRESFDRLMASDAPVRWWHVTDTVTADGINLNGDTSMGGMSNAPMARSSGSRLRNEIRQDFNRVFIFVDSSRVGNVQLAALSDYIAMVALAQIDPAADTSSYPTILSLFKPGQNPTAMTDWDIAYLDGLYHSTRNASSILQQQREISDRMQGGARG